jgi:hypothetical protein
MSNPTPIEPFTQITTNIIRSFTVSCRSLTLFTNATFTVDSFDDKNNLITRQVVPIDQQQYLQWNNNDEYIIQLIASILGYTVIVQDGPSATIEGP